MHPPRGRPSRASVRALAQECGCLHLPLASGGEFLQGWRGFGSLRELLQLVYPKQGTIW